MARSSAGSLRRPSARPFALAVISASLLFAGCSRSGNSPVTSDTVPTPTPVLPSATARSPIESSPEVPPSGSLPVEPPIPEPPAASVAVEGGDPVVGELGSFSWQNSGSDSPWLPGNRIRVAAGERLTVTLAEPLAVANWTASRVPSDDRDGPAPIGLGEGSGGPVSFAVPAHGTWSVLVTIWFADNLGSAAYYWLVEVG